MNLNLQCMPHITPRVMDSSFQKGINLILKIRNISIFISSLLFLGNDISLG